MQAAPTAISHGALNSASTHPATRADRQAHDRGGQHRPRGRQPRADQAHRARPVVVGAADAVGVVVGVVDADDQRDRDDQRQQRLPPHRGVQPGRRAGAGDDRRHRVGQRPRARTGDPLREGGHNAILPGCRSAGPHPAVTPGSCTTMGGCSESSAAAASTRSSDPTRASVTHRHPVRRAQRPDHRRHRRRPRGRVSAAPRRQPRILAAHRAVPGQHVGAARARRAADLRAVRGRQPHTRTRARAPWWCPISWSTAPAAAPTPTSTPAASTSASPIRTARRCAPRPPTCPVWSTAAPWW